MDKKEEKNNKELDLSLTMQQKFNFDSNNLDEEDTNAYKKKNNKNVLKINQKMKEIIEIKNKYRRKYCLFFTLFIIMLLISLGIFVYYNMHPKIKTETIEKEVVPENIVFLGDSITDYYDLDKYYEGYHVVNSGISGNTTEDILNDMENRVYRYNPSKVIILIGTNDLTYNKSNDQIFENIKNIVEQIKKNRKYTEIYVESIYPINNTDDKKIDANMVKNRENDDIKKINTKLKNYCDKNNITYINIYKELQDKDGNLKLDYTEEGLHISEQGYEVITNRLKKYIDN